METDTKKRRQNFCRDYTSGHCSMSELCGRYHISRHTGETWIEPSSAADSPAPEQGAMAALPTPPRNTEGNEMR